MQLKNISEFPIATIQSFTSTLLQAGVPFSYDPVGNVINFRFSTTSDFLAHLKKYADSVIDNPDYPLRFLVNDHYYNLHGEIVN